MRGGAERQWSVGDALCFVAGPLELAFDLPPVAFATGGLSFSGLVGLACESLHPRDLADRLLYRRGVLDF